MLMEMVIMSIKKSDELREVPTKNYFYLFLVLFGTILLMLYLGQGIH